MGSGPKFRGRSGHALDSTGLVFLANGLPHRRHNPLQRSGMDLSVRPHLPIAVTLMGAAREFDFSLRNRNDHACLAVTMAC